MISRGIPSLFIKKKSRNHPVRNPEAPVSHQDFRYLRSLSVTGPHKAVKQIQELCWRWLQPEMHQADDGAAGAGAVSERLARESSDVGEVKTAQRQQRKQEPGGRLDQACEEEGGERRTF